MSVRIRVCCFVDSPLVELREFHSVADETCPKQAFPVSSSLTGNAKTSGGQVMGVDFYNKIDGQNAFSKYHQHLWFISSLEDTDRTHIKF